MTQQRSLDRRIKDALMRCHYVSAYDLADPRLDEALSVLDDRGIRHLWGYPGSLYYLARRAIARGWNRPMRTIVTWGDTLYPVYRRTVEQAFGTRIHDTYGCGEGFQVAAQCGQDQTYHQHTLDVVVEYVDDDGLPVAQSSPGNLLVTRLHPGPMPLIRYRVGDIATAGDQAPCACGRGFDLMRAIQGRETDVILTPSGNRLIVHFFTGILEHFREIESFQVVQEDRTSMVLRVVPGQGYTPEIGARAVERLRAQGAADLRIDVDPVDEIPVPPSGKRRFVISQVPGEDAAKT